MTPPKCPPLDWIRIELRPNGGSLTTVLAQTDDPPTAFDVCMNTWIDSVETDLCDHLHLEGDEWRGPTTRCLDCLHWVRAG